MPRDDHALDLRRPLADLAELGVPVEALDGELARVAVPAVHLDGQFQAVRTRNSPAAHHRKTPSPSDPTPGEAWLDGLFSAHSRLVSSPLTERSPATTIVLFDFGRGEGHDTKKVTRDIANVAVPAVLTALLWVRYSPPGKR